MTSQSGERPMPEALRRTAAQEIFAEYFSCSPEIASFDTARELPTEQGFFRFSGAIAYGRSSGNGASLSGRGELRLPFDLAEIVTNLRQERYSQAHASSLESLTASPAVQHLYYALRPMLPVGVRRHLQRVRLSGWQQIQFPRWPVDTSVDFLMRKTLAVLMQHAGLRSVPFVWFWPDGAPSCVVMTHDVEDVVGRDFSDAVMDLDDSFMIKSAFQIVPEGRGQANDGFASHVRRRGFEVNLHDLNHDGYLYHNRSQFLERAAQINSYARALGCRGFRSGAMYRNQEWFDAFDFSFDMSVPNVAHLEPQRGGCCTVMPYFVGKVLELPLTTTQDYSLFHILGEYSVSLWKQQIELIRATNGFISFITHPDYLVEPRARAVYMDLLSHLQRLREDGQVWIAFPGEVDRWWRSRRQMSIVPQGHSWKIEGPDCDRARLAFATLDGDRVVYTVQN